MIDLALSPVQADLVRAVRATADKEFPPDLGVAAALHGTPAFDTARWRRLAELGCFSLRVDEDRGGLGLGSVEEFLLMLELGRSAASGPLAGSALAAWAASSAGDATLARALMAGERTAGILLGELAVDAEPGALAVRVGAEGIEVVELAELVPVASVDPLSTVSRVARSATVLAAADPSARARLRLLVGGYLVGLAEAATTMAAEYAKVRMQFGAPIGSFQAVKHRCAEMLIRAHPARAQLAVGATLLDAADGSGGLEVSGGCLMALDAAQHNVEDNVQTHGGIGFTAEHPAGVLVTRVLTYRHLAGPADQLVEDILTAERRRPT